MSPSPLFSCPSIAHNIRVLHPCIIQREWLEGYDFTAELKSIEDRKTRRKPNATTSHSSDEEQEIINDGEEKEDSSHRLLHFQMKHRSARAKWTVPESFPDAQVANAYLQPKANYNAEKFDWVVPNIMRVRSYCRDVLGWTEAQVIHGAVYIYMLKHI